MHSSDVFSPADPATLGFDPEALEAAPRFVEEELRGGRFPGAGLVVTRHGRTVLERAWGSYCSSIHREIPYHTGVVNMLYSFSKVVSATVVVMAQQDGLVSYDEPVWHAIPEFRGGGKDAITLRHLMTHSAGIPNVPMGSVLGEERWREGVHACCAAEAEWEPGSRTAYHGLTGMLMAAEVVRRASGGATWDAICRERLFDPLGADSFTFELPSDDVEVALTPQPAELPCPVEPEPFFGLGHPAGGCFGTLADMQRLLVLHLNGGVWQGRRLLEPEAFEEMHRVRYAEEIAAARAEGKQPQHEPWALGWLTRGASTEGWFGFGRLTSERAYGHAGIDTVMGVADPERDLAITYVMTNSPVPSEDAGRLRDTVTNLVVAALR